MGLNLILMILGLIICFGGMYFRRVCSGILGFLCGILGAFVLALVMVGIWHVGDDSTILTVVICGIICAILSAIYYKVCAAINSFLSTFALVTILLAFAGDMDSEMGIIALAAIVALMVAVLSIKYYDYSFIITSAVVGAFIASVNGYELMQGYDLEDLLTEIIWRSYDEQATILIATIILSVLGISVQLHRLKLVGSSTVEPISGQAKKVGQTAAPIVRSASKHVTEIFHQASTEEGRVDLLEEIIKEKLLFIAPIIAFLIIPIIDKIDVYGDYGLILSWISDMTSAVSLGTLIYFILKKNRRFAFFYIAVYTVCYILFILINISTIKYYGFWNILIRLLRYLILWFVLEIVSSIIRREEFKPIVLLLIGVILDTYLINWLALLYIYWFFTVHNVVFTAVAFVTIYLLFKKRDNISIISFNNMSNADGPGGKRAPVSPVDPPIRVKKREELIDGRCPYCGSKVDSDDVFCANCGNKVR